MRSAYDIPADADGSGQTIVIVDAYGSPTVKEDLDIFSTTFRLPPADLEVVYPPGHLAQLPPSGFLSDLVRSWAGETSLDVQWAHAIAPKAKIVLVVSATEFGNDLNVAQRYAIDNHLGQVMSLSFGVFEAGLAGGPNQSHWFLHLKQAHANYEAALAAGISVISISHDYGTGIYGEPSATYPGSDPLVTAVGGTSLFMTDAGQYLGETVWNDFDDCPLGCKNGPIPLATGGAPSILFNAPLYQAPFSGFGTRTTSDVSYNAGCYTGILYYLGFLGPYSGWYIACGTSEGAPQWAAITALVNQSLGAPVGFFNPQIYAIGADPVKYAEVFHDVTVGDNALFGTPFFHANSGYDLPTGLGSPDVDALLKALKSQ
jgi:subtilase family serine protease